MHYTYYTKGTCSTRIDFDLEDGVIHNAVFQGGCNGNLQAIPALIEGCEAEHVIDRIRGIHCGFRDTSCADQLARALTEALAGGKAAAKRT